MDEVVDHLHTQVEKTRKELNTFRTLILLSLKHTSETLVMMQEDDGFLAGTE
jgi:hypothetical protein